MEARKRAIDGARRPARIAIAAAALAALAISPASAAAAVSPELSGSIANAEVLSGVTAVAVSGHYAYVTGYYAGKLAAIDVSDPAEPVIAGASEASSSLTNATTVNIVGEYAYVVSKNRNGTEGSNTNEDGTGNSLTILNIGLDPASPTIVGTLHDTNSLFGGYGVAVSGGYAYVAAQGCLSGQPCPEASVGNSFAVINIANPASPTLEAALHDASLPSPWTGTGAFAHATAVAIHGNYAYVTAAYQNRLTVVNIANPSNPEIVASLKDGTNLSFPVDVAVSGHYAYVTDQISPGRLTVVNVSNPADPQIVTSLSSASLDGAYRVRLRGDFAYVSAYSGHDVAVVDISNPASPRQVAAVPDEAALNKTTGLDLDPSGRYLVASSPFLSSQAQRVYPPFALQSSGPTLTGTVSVITLDPAPIAASIESQPASLTTQTSANFGFSVSDAVSAVQCQLDGGGWNSCTTPTSQAYTALAVGSHTFEVQATDSAGNTSAASYSWTVAEAPESTSPPAITGSPTQGQTLSATAGTWSGYPEPVYTYQWERCNQGGQSCSPITGATGLGYTPASADVGSTLLIVVTATNSAGSTQASSLASGVVLAEAIASSTSTNKSGGTQTVGATKTALTSAQLAAVLLGHLAPTGKAAAISALLRHGGLSVPVKVPEAGRLTIDWYELPAGAKLAKAKPVLVATVELSETGAATVVVKIRLTAAGKRLLKRTTRIRLTALAVFTPSYGSGVKVSKTFLLSAKR
jgi:hypothetical protein